MAYKRHKGSKKASNNKGVDHQEGVGEVGRSERISAADAFKEYGGRLCRIAHLTFKDRSYIASGLLCREALSCSFSAHLWSVLLSSFGA